MTEGYGYVRGNRDDGMKLDFIDIRKAYFNAPARRAVYVELPTEISEPGTCGRLFKSLYGTRGAAQNWEVEYSRFMESIGFVRGTSTPCAFYNQEKELRAVVHGDDFTVLGWGRQLDSLRDEIGSEYEI